MRLSDTQHRPCSPTRARLRPLASAHMQPSQNQQSMFVLEFCDIAYEPMKWSFNGALFGQRTCRAHRPGYYGRCRFHILEMGVHRLHQQSQPKWEARQLHDPGQTLTQMAPPARRVHDLQQQQPAQPSTTARDAPLRRQPSCNTAETRSSLQPVASLRLEHLESGSCDALLCPPPTCISSRSSSRASRGLRAHPPRVSPPPYADPSQ